jgi:hypothetical protein
MNSVETGRRSPEKRRGKHDRLGIRPPRLVGEPRSGSGSQTDRGMCGEPSTHHIKGRSAVWSQVRPNL